MNNIKVDFGQLEIIEGYERVALEDYLDARLFRQRKSYDEYYCDAGEEELLNIDVRDLMILAASFKVEVTYDSVRISSKD